MENGVEARYPIESLEVGDDFDKIGIENARDIGISKLLKQKEPRIACAEKESEIVQVKVRVIAWESDLRDIEFEAAIVSEPELIEGDYGTVIGSDLCETDLSKTKRNEMRDQKEKQKGAAHLLHWRNGKRTFGIEHREIWD